MGRGSTTKVASAVTYPSPSCRPVCPGCGARPVVVDSGRVVGTRVCFRWVTRHCGSTCRGIHTHAHKHTHAHMHTCTTHIHIHAHTHTGPFVARLKASQCTTLAPHGVQTWAVHSLEALEEAGRGCGVVHRLVHLHKGALQGCGASQGRHDRRSCPGHRVLRAPKHPRHDGGTGRCHGCRLQSRKVSCSVVVTVAAKVRLWAFA
jgi:hypothetical protein